LGYVNIPVAIGQALGAKITGWYYGSHGEKATLAMRYLVEHTKFGASRGLWDGDVDHLASHLGIARSEAIQILSREIGQDPSALNELLWATYQPYRIWLFFAAAGVASLVGMLVFARMSRKWGHLNV
jgi:hypothetical protein